jgi:ribosomal protein S18 acetylase RimI-like enzyme
MIERFHIQVDITIRPARREDLRKLEWFGLLTPFRDVIERAYTRAEQGDLAFLVADLNGFPVGQVWVDLTQWAAEGIGVIWALRVLEPLQGLGMGTRLIAAAEQIMRQRGLQTAEIGVALDNTGARRLYERLGYEILRQHTEQWQYTTPDGETHAVAEPEWILRKPLSAKP